MPKTTFGQGWNGPPYKRAPGEFLSPGDAAPLRFKLGEKQLFCDWRLVEPGYGMPFWPRYQKLHGTRPWLAPEGVALKTFRPELGPVVASDEPGGQVGGYATLLADEGRYRLWHEAYAKDARGDLHARLCLLESANGADWTPCEGGVPVPEGATNVVFGAGDASTGGKTGAHGATVFLDEGAAREERYKMVFLGPAPGKARLGAWLYGAASPDGVRWTMLPEPILKTLSDTQNVCFRDERGRYRLYLRGWSPQGPAGGGGRRVVRHAASERFERFPHPTEILRPPSRWGPSVDIYTTACQPWPGASAYLMLPALYDRARDTTEVRLAVSRDGLAWDFPSEEPLLGGGGDPGSQTLYAGAGVVAWGDCRWGLVVHVSEKGHNEYRKRSRALHVATVREDGFTAIEADLKGEFSTFPAWIEGERLRVNAWTRPGGSLRVEAFRLDADAAPRPIPGYGLEDCVPLTGDCRWAEARWQHGAALPPAADGPYRLRFELLRARIHAFRTE